MSPPEGNRDDTRSVLSWESVVDPDEPSATSTDSSSETPPPLAPPTTVDPELGVPLGGLAPISLTIAPLSLQPLPPIPEAAPPGTLGSSNPEVAVVPPPPVLGEMHLDLAPISMATEIVRPDLLARDDTVVDLKIDLGLEMDLDVDMDLVPIETASTPLGFDAIELKIAPLDMPDLTPSGATPLVEVDVTGASAPTSEVAPVPASEVVPTAPAVVAAAPPTPALPDAPTVAPPANTSLDEPPADSVPAAAVRSPGVPNLPSTPPVPAGLPNDAVSADPTPTTIIPNVLDGQIAPPTIPGTETGADTVTNVAMITLPQHQPIQATSGPPTVSRHAPATPVPKSRREQKHHDRLAKQQQRHALKAQQSGAGGIALFFTLLVLVGLIVGAIIYGRPYLFPNEWDEASKPFADAVAAATGTTVDDPVLVTRQAESTYRVTMADALLGEWESEMPLWRSLGLVNASIDANVLRELVSGWTAAYYSPGEGEIFVDASKTPADADGAIAEAMALAALDQDAGWSATLEDASMEGAAFTRGQLISYAREISTATVYGPALSDRRLDVASYLPPVLEYRANAPLTYAELVPSTAVLMDAVVESGASSLSREPELVPGDTLITSQRDVDRGFWYLVFASYMDPGSAYAASNAVVQSSLATADRGGQTCAYTTFSGTDIDATSQISGVLQQWASNAPPEFTPAFSVLADGTMQLSSCDPGAGFETAARFGVGRELARWRSVELAALEYVDVATGTAADRVAAVARVQGSQAGLSLMTLPFDTSAAESARQARIAAAP